MSKESPTVAFLASVFCHHDDGSWERLNHNLSRALTIAISGNFEIQNGDFGTISDRFRWGYWAGTSLNGKHCGERFYALACQMRGKAAKVYENDFGRVPFILEGSRLHEGAEFWLDGLYYRITGWSKDNASITAVGYKNRCAEGKKKLFSATREEWLEIRKGAKSV